MGDWVFTARNLGSHTTLNFFTSFHQASGEQFFKCSTLDLKNFAVDEIGTYWLPCDILPKCSQYVPLFSQPPTKDFLQPGFPQIIFQDGYQNNFPK